MIKSSYEVEVLVNGRPLREYSQEGKVYVEGRKDTKFSLRMRNNSGDRKLFIPTIDGLSVMDGKDASFESSGYIVPAYSTVVIDGWRMSDREVAEFLFSEPDGSYGKKKGKGKNLGVIGCAIFGEKRKQIQIDQRDFWPDIFPKQWTTFPPSITYTSSAGPTALTSTSNPYLGTSGTGASNFFYETSSVSVDSNGSINAMYSNSDGDTRSYSNQDLGTGWGKPKKSEVTTVTFESEDEPREIFEVFYNTREQLEKIGVSFEKEPMYVTLQSFPGETRYCEPPRN